MRVSRGAQELRKLWAFTARVYACTHAHMHAHTHTHTHTQLHLRPPASANEILISSLWWRRALRLYCWVTALLLSLSILSLVSLSFHALSTLSPPPSPPSHFHKHLSPPLSFTSKAKVSCSSFFFIFSLHHSPFFSIFPCNILLGKEMKHLIVVAWSIIETILLPHRFFFSVSNLKSQLVILIIDPD